MDKEKILKAGPIDLIVPIIGSELLAIFREDMTQIRYVPVREYWPHFGQRDPDSGEDEPLVPVKEYRVPGDILSERLELMGFLEGLALARLDGTFAADRALVTLGLVKSEDASLAATLTASTWADCLRSSRDDVPGPSLDSRSWLLDLLQNFEFLWRLRSVLLAFPNAEVVLDFTETDHSPSESGPIWNATDATNALNYKARAFAPTIVLTEGKTDTEFLGAALSILYPHLTDLIRFLDYDRRPEGGAGALANNIRAFAAAGIANRMVVIFDNDTAAAEALSRVDPSSLNLTYRSYAIRTSSWLRASRP